MAKFQMTELVGVTTFTARVSALVGDAANASIFDDITERGKFMKLAAESRYIYAVRGDDIETVIDSVNTATQDGYSIAGLRQTGPGCSGAFLKVTFDGAQVGGAGAMVIGDYVLVGDPVAKGTALSAAPKVCKATDQAVAKAPPFAWRVVSLGTALSGAVGTQGLIERVA